jgi:putative flippase GtrA
MNQLVDRIVAAWHRRAFALKGISFALVGVVNTLIDLAVFLFAYKVLQLPLVPCNVMAWLVAVSCSYVMNTFTTFGPESGHKLRARDYIAFVASGIAGVIAATTTLVLLSEYFAVIGAKLISILVSFVLNFALSHFVVFRGGRSRRDDAAS